MAKQGLMVFYINTYEMPQHHSESFMNGIKQQIYSHYEELKENYELMFIANCKSDKEPSIRIKIFPYKDYKFNIDNMSPGQIENFVDKQLISKLARP